MQNRLAYCIGILVWAQVSFAQQTADITIGKTYRITSKALAEERPYWVSLPGSYDGDDFYRDKRYPVLIVLDADSHFHTVSGIVRAMSVNDEQIPEMIVVGIPNTSRARDLTPSSSAAFSQFLENELLPQLDNTYRTLPYRVLAGHSMAGLFAIQCFLQKKPFQGYLLIDPTIRWNNNAILAQTEAVLTPTDTTWHADVYLAQAENPFRDTTKPDLRKQGFDQFASHLKKNPSKGLRYKHDYNPNEDHFSIPTESFYHGLLFIFQGYKFPLNKLTTASAADIARHYETFARQRGVPLQPPGKLLNQVGLYLLQEKRTDAAIDIFQMNEKWYPTAAEPCYSLGLAFRAKGDAASAMRYFKRALQHNSGHTNAKRAIEELSASKN